MFTYSAKRHFHTGIIDHIPYPVGAIYPRHVSEFISSLFSAKCMYCTLGLDIYIYIYIYIYDILLGASVLTFFVYLFVSLFIYLLIYIPKIPNNSI